MQGRSTAFELTSVARVGPLQTNPVAVVRDSATRLVTGIVEAAPGIVAGLLFVGVAYVLVRVIMAFVRAALDRGLRGESPVYRQFVTTIVAVFLWFAVGLAFLSIVGLEQIAAALGTATGFVALGVSYALSNMLADAVAGIYLLRDRDFNPGDVVTVGDMTGEVVSIELRKTRFAVEGDTVVRANAEIEKRWTKEGDPAPLPEPAPGSNAIATAHDG